LQQFEGAGVEAGVVSNGPDTVKDLLSQAALLPFFDSVISSQAAGFEKPDPRIFCLALGSLGIASPEALFVGDLYDVDILGARAAGLDAVLIDRRDAPRTRDCRVIRSLDELIPMAAGSRTARDNVVRFHQYR